MTQVKAWISPETTNGSFVLSFCAHVFIMGTLAFLLSLNPVSHTVDEDYLDIGYEMFDEPPQIAKEEQKIMQSPEPVAKVDPQAIPDNSPKELQDEKGEVAGTQIAKAVNNLGSDLDGKASATPYYKIKPKYPKAALISGTEGWILFTLDINENGEVENVRIVDGEQREMFQNEAKRAVSQWKYKPFLDSSGNIVRKSDHHVRIDFKLDDENNDSGS